MSTTHIENRIFTRVNRVREKKNLAKFKKYGRLTSIARKHSAKMAKKRRIWHGSGVHKAIKSFEIKPKTFWQKIWFFLEGTISMNYITISGENVAMMCKGQILGFKHPIKTEQDIARALHKNWMNSKGYRANILNSNFDKIGIGVKQTGNKFYATQLFCG